jgi:hypothetical protein
MVGSSRRRGLFLLVVAALVTAAAVGRNQIGSRHARALPSAVTPIGVIESPMNPFSRDAYVMQNQWQDFGPGSTMIQAYAGRRVRPPCTGVLLINRIQWPARSVMAIGRVTKLSIPHAGPLTILLAKGHVLTLATAGGRRGTYDVDDGRETWHGNVRRLSRSACVNYDRG